MLPEQQQRILGYFIEEARDHLNTIEQGLLNLQNTLNDSEMVNEIFRAAHSIKGGAAMLGLNSIQRTAHRFEDFFKVLKECQSIQIDQNIESLFLRMFDNLQALLDQLQSESGLTEDVANRLMSEVEPVFVTLEQHLQSRVHQAGGTMQLEESFAALTQPSTQAITASAVSVFQNSVPQILRQMLQVFKQPETPQTRQQLDQLCNQLAQLGEQFNLSGWCTLCETTAGAIANLDNTYRILAPIVIKEIKQAQELVLADRADAIATCEQLQALSLKTFSSDWDTNFESQDQQLAQTMEVAQQQTTEYLSTKHNSVDSEFLVNIAQLSTEEQIIDWAAEDNLSSLFALNSNDNNQVCQETSDILDFNIEDGLEHSLITPSKDNLSLISSEETLALNSLFGEAQDRSLDLTEAEPAFCDLFNTPEADLENLDLLEVSTAAMGNSDLSSLWAEEPDTPPQIELDIKELSFSLGADDLIACSEELFTLPIVTSDANNDVDSHIDFALSSSSEPKQKFDAHWFVEPEADLTTILECNLSSDFNEFSDTAVDVTPTPTPAPEIITDVESSLTFNDNDLFSVIAEIEPSLDIFEQPACIPSQELDFSLDSTSTDLFSSGENESNLELFEARVSAPSEELDFSQDSASTDLFSLGETESSLDLFEHPASIPSEELDFSQDSTSTDLFGTNETQSNLELFEARVSAPSEELDFSLDSTSTDLFSSGENESNLEPFEARVSAPSEELDFSQDSASTDLFSSGETEPSLDLFEQPACIPSQELDFSLDSTSTDLFSTEENESNLELTEACALSVSEKLDFSLDSTSTDLFSSGETEPSLDLFEQPASIPSQELDFSLDSTSTDLFSTEENESNLELSEDCALSVSEKLDFSLDSTSTDLFSSGENESNLELFEARVSAPSEELDFSLDSTCTDLFSLGETEPSLDLFEQPASIPSVELDFSQDSTSTDLFSSGETEPSLDLFEQPASIPSVELDFSQDSTSTDLFNLGETEPSLDLFEQPASIPSVELDFSQDSTSTDLFNLGETEPSLNLFEQPASIPSVELDFSLDSTSTDLFSLEKTEPSLDLFEQPASIPSQELDFSLDSTSTDLFSTEENESNLELSEDCALSVSEKLDFSLDSTSTDLFSSGETEPSLDLFEQPASIPSVELDFSLDSTCTNLFSTGENESNLELFEARVSAPSEELDFSLESTCADLFGTEENESNLELFEARVSAPSEELDFSLESTCADLFSLGETEPSLDLFEQPASIPTVELDFSLDSTSTDLFSTGENESNLEVSQACASSVSEKLDFSQDSTSTDLFNLEETEPSLDLFEQPASIPSVELDFSLDSTSTDLLSLGETEPSLDLFEQPASIPSVELDFSLDSTCTDLFGTEENESNLELFEASTPASSVENTPELMAEFDLVDSTEMALELELNRLDMCVEEMPSQTKYFHEDLAESIVFDLEVEGELPTEIASVVDDFAQLEALLQEESTSNAMAQSEAQLDLNTVAPVIKAVPQSSNDEFSDLEKLLQETPTTSASPAPVKPQQKQAATNSRRSTFEQMMRVPVKQLDSISNQVGELVVYRNSLEQDQERLRQFLDNLLHQVQQLSDVGSRMQELYERSLVEASLLTTRQGSHPALIDTAPASKGHVTGINFDALEMDRFTGFHTLAQEMIELIVRVREASSDIEFVTGETEQVARQFRQVTTQLQEGITRSRMVPFSQIAERLPRAVRDISLKYGKQAELQIEGKETLIDKVILEQLYDPMTHLVNNAITHGIESSKDRSKSGKSPVGQITIRAFYQGNQTIITISDDGAGIDPERVKAKAIENGLITPEAANNMSRLDVYNLLFQAGFSTKDSVDEFAGRGVGMDVVLTSLSQIRGTITTDSTLGKGTTFTIRLPLTLSICKALCCLSDKARIAFPMDGVEQMIDIPVESIITNAQGQSCLPWRDSLLPLRHLREFLTFNRQISRGTIYGTNRDDNMISVVVLRSADIFFAIQVDQVLGEQEIVIKQFEAPAPKPVGIAGATILGDGRIMPIADVLELIDLSMGRIRHNTGTWWTANDTSLPPITTPVARTEPMVLIIDDSITVRELLSMTFVNAGYRVEQARDGQEAWDKLRDGLPCDLIFCDIEMPRMDGLELLSRMQQDERLSQLPIAMLTSRGSDRHRQMALQLGASGYFTKPYLEEALLDGAQRMLKGEVLLAGQRLSD